MQAIVRRFLGPFCMILIGLLLSEGLLRIVPSPVQYPPLYNFDYKDSLLGVELFPGVVHTEVAPCYTSRITTNAAGWRDKERSVARVPGLTRIAVLGDSFMAGTQVNDDEVFARQLETMLGPDKVEVLNFGLSSIGTEQEEILYEHVVKAYDPDIVLLAFYNNDPENNDPDLEGGPNHETRLTFRDEGGELLSFRKDRAFDGTRRWLRIHSATFRLVTMAYRLIRQKASSPAVPGGFPAYPREYGVFETPPNADWERAWGRTERAVQRLQSHIPAPKRLIAFSVPEMLQTAPDPAALIREQYGREPPTGFTPRYPIDRFAAIAARNGIPFIDLQPRFVEEQEKRGLAYPYLYYTCDGHWNASGHAIAAETVAAAVRLFLPR